MSADTKPFTSTESDELYKLLKLSKEGKQLTTPELDFVDKLWRQNRVEYAQISQRASSDAIKDYKARYVPFK